VDVLYWMIRFMNKRKLLLFFVFILFQQECKPGITDDYFQKLWAFFLIEASGTFVHECGHAVILALGKGSSQIFLGGEPSNSHQSDKKINLIGGKYNVGYTRVNKLNNINTRNKYDAVVANGPILAMAYFFILYKAFGYFENRLSPSFYKSLRLFACVKMMEQLFYGFVPLSLVGDAKHLYSRKMDKKKYEKAANDNFDVLKTYAGIAFIVNGMNKINKKWVEYMGDPKKLEEMAAFNKEHAELLFILKISYLYSFRTTWIHLIISTLAEVNKDIVNTRRKAKELDPVEQTPMDFVPRLLISPLLM